MAAGRPKSELDLPEGWKDKLYELYRKGGSDEEAKALIWEMRGGSFSNNLWERWLKEEPEFWETIKECRMLAHAWWMNTGRKGVIEVKNAPSVNTGLWFINMKNRFGWRDKVETTFGGDAPPQFTFNIVNSPPKESIEKPKKK